MTLCFIISVTKAVQSTRKIISNPLNPVTNAPIRNALSHHVIGKSDRPNTHRQLQPLDTTPNNQQLVAVNADLKDKSKIRMTRTEIRTRQYQSSAHSLSFNNSSTRFTSSCAYLFLFLHFLQPKSSYRTPSDSK